jgi:hypothetical protein
MKSSRLTIAVAFVFFALLAPAVAETGALRATIPFDFTVGARTLPAGDYEVSISGSLLMVTRTDGPGTAMKLTTLIGGGWNEDVRPRLIFHCYGNHRFLSVAWMGGANHGHDLQAPTAELEYARMTKQEQKIVLASR